MMQDIRKEFVHVKMHSGGDMQMVDKIKRKVGYNSDRYAIKEKIERERS